MKIAIENMKMKLEKQEKLNKEKMKTDMMEQE